MNLPNSIDTSFEDVPIKAHYRYSEGDPGTDDTPGISDSVEIFLVTHEDRDVTAFALALCQDLIEDEILKFERSDYHETIDD